MAYNHGVKVSEVATSVLPPVTVSAGVPFIVGCAPVNMTDPTNVNKPVMCSSYVELVQAFGFVPAELDSVSGMKKYAYSISEFAYSQFSLFGVGPAIVVNVLDPTKHKKSATTKNVTLDTKTGAATIAETGILIDSVVLKNLETAYTLGEDYELTFDSDGYLVVTSLQGDDEFKCAVGTSLSVTAEKLDPTMVDIDDIVGGVSVDGAKSGFELVNDVFPKFRLVPGILLSPGYSANATVAAIMAAKCVGINEHFSAVSVIDVPTDKVKHYTGVAEWKNSNNVVDPQQISCWPMVALDDTVYHLSTQAAALLGRTDSEHDDVPYASPSNKTLQMTSTVLADGSEVTLGPDTGAYLNSQGVITALNFIGGWVLWGNRTACYPGNTDVKDSFIPIRRMFGWVGNTLVQTFWQRVDAPLNRRQIDTVLDSANIWLNGLAAKQYILGGRVEFLESENSTTDLMDGIARFHVYLTPPSPNREIDFVVEYDVSYLETLFG